MTTVVIGGGWSGLAAAVTLAKAGQQVHLIEAAKQLGGRARNVQWQDKTLDNGQHLMIGAYDRMLAMMQLVGVDIDNAFNRQAINISIIDTEFKPLHLSAQNSLPWPLSLAWSLFRSAGLSGLVQLTRLQKSIPHTLLGQDKTVMQWLIETKQSARFIKQLWEPLCLATLNTPIESASAILLATVLNDSLGQTQTDADLLVPQQPLADLFPHIAADYIQQYDGSVSLQTRVSELIISNDKVTAIKTQSGQKIDASSVIVATNPSQCAELVSPFFKIDKPTEYPICTVYLQYPADTRLGSPMIGMTGTISQWIFDRSEQDPGLMAVVISAEGPHQAMSKTELITKVSTEVHQLFPFMPQQAQQGLVIREKRATFACSVNISQQRPVMTTPINNLYLAGDYVANGYPATLEGAIRNGEACSQHIIKQGQKSM